MKHVQKLACFLMALILTLSLGITAFAAEGGSITIENPVDGETYTAYKIFDVQYDTNADGSTGSHYTYTITDGSSAWFNDVKGFMGSTLNADGTFQEGPPTVDSTTNVITGNGLTLTPSEGTSYVVSYTAGTFNAASFAKYLNTKRDGKTGTKLERQSGTVSASGLPFGYYLIDTSLGSLCSLDTTNPDVTMKEKNKVPQNVKRVEEDSSGDLGAENHADIGQTIKFTSTVTVYPGTDNLIFHDQMRDGLKFTAADAANVSIVLKNQTGSLNEELVRSTAGAAAGTYDYTVEFVEGGTVEHVSDDITGDCTFHIRFEDSIFATLSADGTNTLTITYTATLDDNAVIGVAGNTNASMVSYGDNFHATRESTTKTRTFGFSVFKKDKDTGTGLNNTKFELHANGADSKPGDVIWLVKTKNGTASTPVAADEYRIAKKTGATDASGNPVYEADATKEITTNDSGKFVVNGLDAGTYHLVETKAHDGYNELKNPVVIDISYAPGQNGADGTVEIRQNNTPVPGDITIENGSGGELPDTGGIGTTIFYVVGSILLVGAVVLLVTKRRMRAEK